MPVRLIRVLEQPIYCTTHHGRTGIAIDEGELQPGTLIKNILVNKESGVCSFLASTDNGSTWYQQRADRKPKTSAKASLGTTHA